MLGTALNKVIEWFAPTVVIAAVCLVYFGPDELDNLLRYERGLIFSGEYWRIVSGHFTHINLNHLLLNCAGLILAWSLLPIRPRPDLALLGIAILSGLCGMGLLILEPQVSGYKGLTALIHALLAVGAVLNLTERGSRWWGLVLLSILSLKVYSESFGTRRSIIAQWIDAPLVTEANLWGLATGATVAILVLLGAGLGELITRTLASIRSSQSSS